MDEVHATAATKSGNNAGVVVECEREKLVDEAGGDNRSSEGGKA